MGDEGGKNGHLGKIPGYPISRHTPKKTHELVGGFKHVLFFHNILDNPSQTDELIFFKMVKTTNQMKLHVY
jgi:hypothetical protein